jgi:hypothetical protein
VGLPGKVFNEPALHYQLFLITYLSSCHICVESVDCENMAFFYHITCYILGQIFVKICENISTGLGRGPMQCGPSGPWPGKMAHGPCHGPRTWPGHGGGTVRCGPWPDTARSVPAQSGPSGPRAAPGRPVVHL